MVSLPVGPGSLTSRVGHVHLGKVFNRVLQFMACLFSGDNARDNRGECVQGACQTRRVQKKFRTPSVPHPPSRTWHTEIDRLLCDHGLLHNLVVRFQRLHGSEASELVSELASSTGCLFLSWDSFKRFLLQSSSQLERYWLAHEILCLMISNVWCAASNHADRERLASPQCTQFQT